MTSSGQLSLFGGKSPAFDATFAHVQRVELAGDAWFELVPSWLERHDEVLRALVDGVRWRQESREMYERVVEVPRLIAVLPADGPGHALIEPMRSALSQRYGEAFERVGLAYYRDGNDSVAWHGDYVARNMSHALVATVSVGARRRFLLRPKGGGSSLRLLLGEGDLLVMGGTCQRTWQHCVPKVASAAERVSIMFRPTWVGADARYG